MSAGELWFVKLPNGDVHHVTVDQLDMAFEAGHINADTLVLADGSSEWTKARGGRGTRRGAGGRSSTGAGGLLGRRPHLSTSTRSPPWPCRRHRHRSSGP